MSQIEVSIKNKKDKGVNTIEPSLVWLSKNTLHLVGLYTVCVVSHREPTGKKQQITGSET